MKHLIKERLTKIFDPYKLDFENTIDLDESIKVMGSLHATAMARVLKTWTNGWITSHRMHEEYVHPCLLGCQGKKDDLSHYVHCPYIFCIMKFLVPEVSSDPILRLGLVNSTVPKLKNVCCMFSAFHGLRASVHAGKIKLQPLTSTCMNDGTVLRRSWSTFAQAFCVEALELAVHTRSFSLPKFINLLVNGCVHLPEGPPMIANSANYNADHGHSAPSFLSTNLL